MTKSDYLSNLRQKESTIVEADLKKKPRRRIVAGILILGSILLCLIGIWSTSSEKENGYRAVKEDPGFVSLENLDYKDTFDIWNAEAVGNDVNTLLDGGKLLCRSGVSVLPAAADRSKYEVVKDGKMIGQINSSISSINQFEDRIYYRDDLTHRICVFEMNEGKASPFLQEEAARAVVTGDKLYFTSFSGNSLYAVDLTGDLAPKTVLNGSVDQFVVVGKTVLFRGYDNVLYSYNMDSNKLETLAESVERFFLDGSLIIESGNVVYRTKPDGTKPTTIYEAHDDSFKLVGAYQGNVFFQADGQLSYIDGHGAAKTIAVEACISFSSLVVEGSRLLAITLMDEPSKEAVEGFIDTSVDGLEVQDGQ